MPDRHGITLDGRVEKIISVLTGKGYSAYPVGGCVRDMLTGKTPSDYDVTTDAFPQEVTDLFSGMDGFSVYATGLKHGTVTVVYGGLPVEITVFRSDGAYSDHRRPDSVEFGKSLTGDLARRDFTVNAMAYDTASGEIIDPYGGQNDIADRLIRCVGDAEKRFGEDALRIMRALRFCSATGFDIEDVTKNALIKMKSDLDYVSAERKFSELKKLICGKNAENVIIEYAGVIAEVVPCIRPMIGFDQKNRHHVYDLLTHTAKVVSGVPSGKVHLRLAALYHDTGKPLCVTEKDGERHFRGHADISESLARGSLHELRSDNETIKKVCLLVKYHDIPVEPDERHVKRLLGKIGSEAFDDLMILKIADNNAQSPDYSRIGSYDEIIRIKRKLIDEEQCFDLHSLELNGNDLIALGYTGSDIGAILKDLLSKVINGELENDKNVLTDYLYNNY